MALRFEWDDTKARSNSSKHGVSFPVAATVFADPLSLLLPDTQHSQDEERFVYCLVTLSGSAFLLSPTPEETKPFASSVPASLLQTNDETTNKPDNTPDPDMADEYDFSQGQRGVYAQQYAQGTNLIALAPDMAAIFPDSDAVNAALRTLVQAARQSVPS